MTKKIDKKKEKYKNFNPIDDLYKDIITDKIDREKRERLKILVQKNDTEDEI